MDELFKFDDGDGKLTTQEILEGLKGKVTEKQAQMFVEFFDQDGDGSLTKEELKEKMKKMLKDA